MVVIALVIGLLMGAIGVLLLLRPALRERSTHAARAAQLERDLAATEARLELVEGSADERLRAAVKSASLEAYAQTNTTLVDLAASKLDGAVKPLQESLRAVDDRVQELDRARAQSYGQITRQLSELGTRTTSLTNALKTPHVRGRWGEIQLRRVVEIAGMLPYCDFAEQVTTITEEGRLRPDLVIRLPGEKQVVVDAKVPLSAYLEAHEADGDELREERLADHSRQVREHLRRLSEKAYWQQFADSPEWVVMFLPDEGFFRSAWELNPSLVEDAVKARVHIASPTTLIVLLQAIAFGWQQERVAADAREVHRLGRELYDRIVVTTSHWAKVGGSLDKAVDAFNSSVGSLERRVLPTARKLGQKTMSDRELPELEARSVHTVPLNAPELVEGAPALEAVSSDADAA